MPIPTIPGSARVQDPREGPKRNLEVEEGRLSAVRQAVGAADSAVQRGLDVIDQYEQRKRKAEEVYIFNRTSIALNKATSDYRHKMRAMPDQEIVPTWTSTAAQTKADILGAPDVAKMGPPAKAKLAQSLDSWAGESTAEFQTAADLMGHQRRTATATAAADEFLETGDPSLLKNANASIDAAVRAGDITPDQAGRLTSKFPQRLATAQASTMAQHAPGDVLKRLSAGDWPEIKDEKVRNSIATAARGQQRTNFEALNQNVNPLTGEVDEGTIKAKMDSGDIDRKTGQNLIDAQKRKADQASAKQDNDTKAMLMADVHDTLAWQDKPDDYAKELTTEAAQIKNHVFRKQVQDAINRNLEAVRKNGTTTDHPALRDALLQLRRESGDAVISREILDRTGKDYRVSDSDLVKMGIDPKDRVKASEERRVIAAKQQNDLRQWFSDYQQQHAGKVPTEQEIGDERNRILHPQALAAAKATLTPDEKTMGAQWNVGDVAHDAKGRKARWDGQQWVEVK